MAFWVQIGESGGQVWMLLGAIWDDVGSKMELFGLSWAMLGHLRGDMIAQERQDEPR